MRGIWNHLSRDDGMTIVEIMIAAVIMFIMLSAVLGLVGQTTMMGLQAKEQNILTNALNAYIESVHALPFEEVALVADGGSLETTLTQTIAGYTVEIHPTITPVTGNTALKTLDVDIVVTDGRGVSKSTSTQVVIRDRTQFLTTPVASSALDPHVEFGSLAPPDGSVAWGTSYAPMGHDPEDYATLAQPLYLDVTAEAPEDKLIANVTASYGFTCEDPLGAQFAFTPNAQSWSSTGLLFRWDTTQKETIEPEDGSTPYQVSMVQDGWRTLQITATDDSSPARSDSTQRYYLVDNLAPVQSDSISGAAASATAATISWKKVMDGTSGAEGYELEWASQGMSDTDGTVSPFAADTGAWDTPQSYAMWDAGDAPTVLSREIITLPFSRYAERVRACSPRFRSGWTDQTRISETVQVPAVFVSRPKVSGTYVVDSKTTGNPKYLKVTAKLTVTPPTFPTTAITYEFWRVDGTTPTKVQSGSSNILDDPVTSSNYKVFPVRSYYVIVKYTPAGYAGGSPAEVKSNTVTTSSANSASGTYTFTEGVW